MEEELRMSEDADRRKKEEEERARTLALSPPAATQTIEAQAGIGALEETSTVGQEQSSVSAPPPAAGLASPYPGEETYPPPTVEPAAAETASTEPESRAYPRISPPSTGETVASSRHGANGRVAEPAAETAPVQEAATDSSMVAEANIGAEPAPLPAGSTQEPKGTETVSQHG
jgi:sec-independent protein translocase protein TatB